MRRRPLLAGVTVGVLGGAAGVGGALWVHRQPSADEAAEFWPMRFSTPEGGSLEIASLKGKPLLLNFWATWCPPCVTELPLLDRFHREQQDKGWQVIGLAVDNRDPVVDFLAKRPVSFPIGLAGMGGVELSRRMGNVAGALPFTLVFERGGAVLERKLGTVAAQDLQRWVSSVA